MYGALCEKSCVCDGYAQAFEYLYKELGGSARVVVGQAGTSGHAWNVVYLDDSWYELDVTFDSQVGNSCYDYFNRTTAEFSSNLNGKAKHERKYLGNIVPVASGTKYTYDYVVVLRDEEAQQSGETEESSENKSGEDSGDGGEGGEKSQESSGDANSSNSADGKTDGAGESDSVNNDDSGGNEAEKADGTKNAVSDDKEDNSANQSSDSGQEDAKDSSESGKGKQKAEKIDKKQKNTSLKKLKVGKRTITVHWKKQTAKGIKGYEIQYSTDRRFEKRVKTIRINKTGITSKKIKKLKAGRKYYVRIRTFKKTKAGKVYSRWSKVKSVKVK